MIFKKVDKVRTFEISPRLILWASLFFIFYIVVTIVLASQYFDIYREKKMQARKIGELRGELNTAAKSLERAKHHITLLNEYIGEENVQSQGLMFRADYTGSYSPKIVDIDDVKVQKDGSAVNVTFRIVNKQPDEEPLGGYIFVLVSPKDSDQSEVWVYPSSLLKGGLPVDYTSGHRFFIQNFLSIRSKFRLNKSIEKPLILEILVYDRDGELILKKVVEV